MLALAIMATLIDFATTALAIRKGGHEALLPVKKIGSIATFMAATVLVAWLMLRGSTHDVQSSTWFWVAVIHNAAAAWNLWQLWRRT